MTLSSRGIVTTTNTTVAVQRKPAIISADGEVIELDTSIAFTVEEAAQRLPPVQAVLKELRRFEGILAAYLIDDMAQKGQTERRVGEVIWEAKPETAWVVDDPAELHAILVEAFTHGEITREELNAACPQLVTYKPNHTYLRPLAKRVPAIETLRRQVSGEVRLRRKNGSK